MAIHVVVLPCVTVVCTFATIVCTFATVVCIPETVVCTPCTVTALPLHQAVIIIDSNLSSVLPASVISPNWSSFCQRKM